MTLIRQGQACWEIPADLDAELTAEVIHGSLRGILSLWIVDPQAIDLLRLGKGLDESVTRSLRAQPQRIMADKSAG